MDTPCWMRRRRGFRSLFSGVAPACAQLPDPVRLLRLAIAQAGTIDRDPVRQALENLPPHQGLVRFHGPAFTAQRHDALDAGDFRLFRFADGGAIVSTAVP